MVSSPPHTKKNLLTFWKKCVLVEYNYGNFEIYDSGRNGFSLGQDCLGFSEDYYNGIMRNQGSQFQYKDKTKRAFSLQGWLRS